MWQEMFIPEVTSGTFRLASYKETTEEPKSFSGPSQTFMPTLSDPGHHFSGGIRDDIQPVVDRTSHPPVVRLHGPEEEVLFLLQSKASQIKPQPQSFQFFFF